MKTASIREDVLRDPRYPVRRIADQLVPYLKVIVEQFHPEQVILFGSYSVGFPPFLPALGSRLISASASTSI